MPSDQQVSELHARLGYQRLSRVWAKIELFAGLTAAGSGLLLGDWALVQPPAEPKWEVVAGGLVLFVLGSYLALAGHRSHLYQSNNELIAYLADEVRRTKE